MKYKAIQLAKVGQATKVRSRVLQLYINGKRLFKVVAVKVRRIIYSVVKKKNLKM